MKHGTLNPRAPRYGNRYRAVPRKTARSQKKSYIHGAGPPNSRSSPRANAGSTNPNVTASAAESDPL